MIAEETYWQQLRPFQDGLSISDQESRKEKYLIHYNKDNNNANGNNDDDDDKSFRKLQDLDSTKQRFKQLLSISGLFRHFIESKAKKDPNIKKILDELDSSLNNKDSKNNNRRNINRRKSEKEEDAELLKDEENDGFLQDGYNGTGNESNQMEFQFRDSPLYINGKLRP